MLTIETQRLTFAYRRQGNVNGVPMLLLHGSFGSSRWWVPLLELLPEDILAVAPDLRGCGGSAKSDYGYGIPDQANDVWALVEALGWRTFDLVAHSSSAAIAVELVLQHPQSVTTLTLIDPVPIEGVFTPVDAFMLLEQMRADRDLLADAIAAMMPSFAAADEPENGMNHQFLDQLVTDASQMAPTAFTGVAAALNRWNRFADAQRLTLPTLIVWGEHDIFVDRDAVTRTFIAIPGANNLEVLRGVGHSPMVEAPFTLLEKLVDFITDDFADYEHIRATVED